MRTPIIFAVLFGLSVFTSKAQNLLTNGSFEAGNLSGWTSSGNLQVENDVPVSNGSYALVLTSTARPTGTLSQSFATAVGAPYLLSYDYAATGTGLNESILASIADSNGRTIVATQAYPGQNGTSYYTHTALFVATTASMTVTFQDESAASTTRDGLLDNVQVTASPPFSFPGKYKGTLVETSSFAGGDIAYSVTFAIEMDIDNAGRFTYLEHTTPVDYWEGTINNSGAVTMGNDGLATGTAAFRGTDIEFEVAPESGLGGNFYSEAFVETRKFSIHKVAP